MTRKASALLPLLLVLAGCTADEVAPSEEELQAREMAGRQACIAERLMQVAEDELQTLESIGVVTGPLAFQQAYTQHAELRLSAYAAQDSALNHAATPADSARYAAAAAGIQISVPEAESVEDNVIRSYESKFMAIFGDPDHPCNWESELREQD